MKRDSVIRHSMNRVINHLQHNCGSSINLESMADIACYSKYHFSRIFQHYVKETPYQFLYRTRLEYAARSLSYLPEKSITEIAMDCGFYDTQALSNAFRHRFHKSPTSFKKAPGSVANGFDRPGPLADLLDNKPIKIGNRPEIRLAYIRNFGPYTDKGNSVARTSARILDWAKNKGLWSEQMACIGLFPSNPALTPPQSCIFDACVQVPDEIEEDDLVSIQTIPSGRYATLNLRCPPQDLNLVWKWLAFKWLPHSGETYAMGNCYEIFYPRLRGIIAPELGVELCLRLER